MAEVVLMGIGLNLTKMHLFWLLLYLFVCTNSKLCNPYENINVFHCVLFHTILTVAQNTWRGNFTIIPECYSVYSVVFPSVPPWGVFWAPQVILLKVSIQ